MKMKTNFVLLLSLVFFFHTGCSKSASTVCGRYSESALNDPQADGKPAWIGAPGTNCAVGYADWGNSNKEKALFAAHAMAKENLVREIASETVQVESELSIQKRKTNEKVTVTAQGSSHLKSKGEKVRLKTKRRAVWYRDYKVWVLVERIP